VEHPAIGILRKDGTFDLIKEFTYEEFKARLS
jgi:carboxynorspermidine decarboxylase